MKFGPRPPKLLPYQDSAKVMLHAERWQRAAWAQQRWAERAKKAVDYFEGRQWTEEQLAKMKGRPALTFNVIAPLVRLILGYQRGNKTDITFQAGQDDRSTEQVAEALTRVEKSVATNSNMPYVDTEVFMDGLICSRGFYDTRLSFEENDLGEVMTKACDPFAIYPDPDADTYDLNESAAFIHKAKMVSVDEIEMAFGRNMAELVRPFTMGRTPLAPISSLVVNDEITPVRQFGERTETHVDYWDQFYSLMGDFVDTRRKSIRMIESQYKVVEPRNVVIDLETGDKKTLPLEWGEDRIAKILAYGEQTRNPLRVERRLVERIHWTIMAGDVILYDRPSIYDRFTIDGYFPYFRRGMTRGMVDDLIDPQMEKNKRRSARIEIASKTANGGWLYHQDALDPIQEANIKKYGSVPGVNIKWKGDKPPAPIDAVGNPMKHERLEHDSDDDVRSISGVNESALGQLDRVQSGRAIEARQRQAVLSVQMYMDNLKRSKMQVGRSHLSIFQNHYTEKRMYRIMGEDGQLVKVLLNAQQTDPSSGARMILNDVTVGKYNVVVDEAPLSATFLNAQFDEMMLILEKMGPVLGDKLGLFSDLIMDMSSLPRKDEWIERFKKLQEAGQPKPDPLVVATAKSVVELNTAKAVATRVGAWKDIQDTLLDQSGLALDAAIANQQRYDNALEGIVAAGPDGPDDQQPQPQQGMPPGAPPPMPEPMPGGM